MVHPSGTLASVSAASPSAASPTAQLSENKHVCLHRDALGAPPGRQAARDARGARWAGGSARGGRRQPRRAARAPPCRPGGPRRDGRLQDLVGAPPEQVEVHAPRGQQRATAVVLQLVWDGHHLRVIALGKICRRGNGHHLRATRPIAWSPATPRRPTTRPPPPHDRVAVTHDWAYATPW
jgi:hypothetical protein